MIVGIHTKFIMVNFFSFTQKLRFLYPCKTNVFGGILESACLSVCPFVQNNSFCQSAGRVIKSHCTFYHTNLCFKDSVKTLQVKEKMLVTSVFYFNLKMSSTHFEDTTGLESHLNWSL